jgi:hypothetical protein
VVKLLVVPGPSKDMKEFTLERSPLHVHNVETPLVPPVISKHMEKLSSAEYFKDMNQLTGNWSPLCVSHMESLLFFVCC